MKVTFSPLVAGASGKAAHAVAAAWKGVSYVRKLVTPHNPQSTDQTTQRGYMARMSPWFRSLPSALRTWLDALAVGQGKSGFNLMVALDLKHLAAAEDPEIAPANPNENAVFSAADGGSAIANKVDVDWVQGVAVTGEFAHVYTCPVDPNEVGKEEPDGWTAQSTFTTVQTETLGGMSVLNTGKDYHVVIIVADANTVAGATKFSGGIGATCTSG